MKASFVIKLYILLGLLSLFFSACASTQFVAAPADASSVYAQLASKPVLPETLRLQAKVDYFDEVHGERVVGRDFVISAKSPGLLRITLSSFDKALSTMVADGKDFYLLDTTQNVFLTGEATAENISQLLPIYLSANDIFQVLLGNYPTDNLTFDWKERVSFDWDGVAAAYRLSMPQRDGTQQQVFFSYPELDIVEIRFVRDNVVDYRYIAKDFTQHEQQRFPNKMSFSIPEQKLELRLRVQHRDTNLSFKPQVFTLTPVEGMPIRYLSSPTSSSSPMEP